MKLTLGEATDTEMESVADALKEFSNQRGIKAYKQGFIIQGESFDGEAQAGGPGVPEEEGLFPPKEGG